MIEVPNGKTNLERRFYLDRNAHPCGTRALEHRNSPALGIDVSLNDDQMRARCRNAGANLALVYRLVLNLFRLDTSRKCGIRTRRILAASSDAYRQALLGLTEI